MKIVSSLVLALAIAALPARGGDFTFGADLSFADEMDDCNAAFKDQGQVKDVFAIFRDHGTNLIRLRLWVDPSWTKYGTKADIMRSIKRAKAAGLKVLLDFHYSDDWADPHKQIVPAAWADIADTDKLADTLYRYTFDTLKELDAAGLMPDMVQVGNEINSDLLVKKEWHDGEPIDWPRNAKLINAGIRAVRDAGKDAAIKPLVMLHIAQPENTEIWFADAVKAGVVDFDIIGISYYSKWTKSTIAGMGAAVNRLRHRYPFAKVMIAETAYPWTLSWADNSSNLLGDDALDKPFGATPDGQKDYLVKVTQTVIANGGDGVIVWAPDWVSTSCRTRWGQGSGWENATFFDFDHNALPAIDWPKADYIWPVKLTFRFTGVAPAAGTHFILWSDIFGARDIAVQLPDGLGRMEYADSAMPGQKFRLQVFTDPTLRTRLIEGAHVVEGFYADTAPAHDATIDITLTPPK